MSLEKELSLTALFTLPAALLAADPDPNSLLGISNLESESACVVEIENPGNDVWALQSSPDFSNWNEVETIKVHNGSFKRSYPENNASPLGFFRTVYDPDLQNIESTVENALHLPEVAINYANQVLPPHLLTQQILNQDNTPDENPITDLGAQLGRVLFYDKRLSTNQTVSCASCHQAEHGFSDPRQFSVGFDGGLTGRNSMGLTSARYYQREAFFWDERAATLEEQVLQPIQNEVEMGMTLNALTNRLSQETFYAELFTSAFGSPEVTSERISMALAQFVRSIISTESKYDLGVANNFQNFTVQEDLGRRIFNGRVGNATCNRCHGTDNFVPGGAINNNGLENPYVDRGLAEVTGRARDEGLFKVPSLRNIELTAPYMHDGRFATLEEVVEFYDSGVVNHPNLSPPLFNNPAPGESIEPLRLNLSDSEKAALVAFLKTLTDANLVTDERFSDPFNYGDRVSGQRVASAE